MNSPSPQFHENDIRDGKLALVVVSLIAAFMAGVGVESAQEIVSGVVTFVVVVIIYPLTGSGAMKIYVSLRDWAYENEAREELTRGNAMTLAALWPANLLYAFIVYPAMKYIHWLFPQSR